MPQEIHVHLLPALAGEKSFQGATAVIIDVLRASSTIITALAAGATEVAPCFEIEEAQRLAGEIRPMRPTLLGGERGGRRIAGFDLSNSPYEYTAEEVAGRSVVFTTTNGTRALQVCGNAETVYIGAFVNLSALCDRVQSCRSLRLVCAGTDGRVTLEDVLFAGAVVERVSQMQSISPRLNDEAMVAAYAWKQIDSETQAGALELAMRQSRGGSNLIEIGQAADIAFCAQQDRFTIVPRFDQARRRIVRG